MLKIIPTNQFKRDVQKIAKDKTKNLEELSLVINMLARGKMLPYSLVSKLGFFFMPYWKL